jgi:hypothetical protein
MMNYALRMLADHHRRLAALLRAAMPSESVAFLLCRRAEGHGAVILLADEVVEVDASDYVRRGEDIASVTPLAMARVAQAARIKGRVIVMAHLHPMTESGVEFSMADHIGNQRSFGFFHRRVPQAEHVALVWNARVDECRAVAYDRTGTAIDMTSVVVVDDDQWRQFVPSPERRQARFDRQALLLGRSGQEMLGTLNVAVAGLGGTGSLTSLALVHHGVRKLLLLDDQVLDETNMPRVPACKPTDVGHLTKVEIAKNYVYSHAPDAKVEALPINVESDEARPYLIEADVVVICTDNTTSRAYLNQLAQQYLIPVLDLGVQFSINDQGKVTNEIGRINLVRPGSPCLWCTGHINPARLAAESVPAAERDRADSYLRGFDDPQPSMLAFNMEVVGRGIQHLVGFVTGLFFQPSEVFEQRTFLTQKGGSLARLVTKGHRDGCPVCGEAGAVGLGSDVPMSIRQRAA